MELSGENGGWFLAVKNSTVLPHYPRKIKYLESILKISLKREVLCNLGENFFDNYARLYLILQREASRTTGQKTLITEK